MEGTVIVFGVVAGILLAIICVCCVIYLLLSDRNSVKAAVKRNKSENQASLLAVIGSGGHTTELLRLINELGDHYQPRYYVMATTDTMSEEKVKNLESSKKNKYDIYKVPRSREVKQAWITSVISTLYASLYSFPLVFKLQPEIILCNGPGTCIPICFAGIFLKLLMQPIQVIYIESICRVESLSLSGRILYHLADQVLVQWPQLQRKYPKTKYIGRVV